MHAYLTPELAKINMWVQDNITSELTSSLWFNKNVTSSAFRLNIAWTNGDWERDLTCKTDGKKKTDVFLITLKSGAVH